MKKFLLALQNKQRKLFEKGTKLERFYPAFEANDTFLFTPGYVTKGPSHVRDGLDLKRLMGTVVLALGPCFLMAMYNTGYQIHRVVEHVGDSALIPGWRTSLIQWIFAHTPLTMSSSNILACAVHGALYFVPLYITGLAVGGILEVTFAIVRRHEVNEGFLVTSALFPLILPPTLPLWQAAIGVAFGVVIGKEIFGGTGMNFLNPALVCRAFLFFAYPAFMSGDVWVAIQPTDGFTGATWLGALATGSAAPGAAWGAFTWFEAFIGRIPGSMGETSTLACILGALVLLQTRIGSWRTMLGVVLGTLVIVFGLNAIGSDTNPMLNVPFHWHIVLGGWAFGLVFMATDPVSSAFTNTGKLVYGFSIGVLAILIRCVNPAYPEGMMLGILFMNMFAPLIDHYVVRANVRRRLAHYGR